MKILFLVLLVGKFSLAQFENPLITKTQLLQESELVEDERIKLFCKVFESMVSVEKIEPGFVGNSVYVKTLNEASVEAKRSECNEINLSGFKKIPIKGSVIWGVKGKYVFLKDPDELSAKTKFEIYNAETLELLYAGSRNNDHLFKIVTMGKNRFSLEYFQLFSVPCELKNNKMSESCWKGFLKQIQSLKDNKKTGQVSLPLPTCPETKTQKKFQIYLKVQVPNIDKKNKKLLYAKPICELSP